MAFLGRHYLHFVCLLPVGFFFLSEFHSHTHIRCLPPPSRQITLALWCSKSWQSAQFLASIQWLIPMAKSAVCSRQAVRAAVPQAPGVGRPAARWQRRAPARRPGPAYSRRRHGQRCAPGCNAGKRPTVLACHNPSHRQHGYDVRPAAAQPRGAFRLHATTCLARACTVHFNTSSAVASGRHAR